MTTPRLRSRVSSAAALALAVLLGACASSQSHRAAAATATTDSPAPAILFQNQARVYVHVYLVDDDRQWLLGRVEPGARMTLPIPTAALDRESWRVRLVVLEGTRMAVGVARARGGVSMPPQPIAELAAQRFTFTRSFAGGELTWMPTKNE